MSARNEKEAGKLILSNFQMFNEAVLLFEREVQPAIIKALDECIEVFCMDKSWYSAIYFHEDGGTWFCPRGWLLKSEENEENPVANFYIEYASRSSDEYFVLDDFCALNGGVGFGFCVSHKEFGGRSEWNRFYKSQGADITQAMVAKGFIDDKNGVFFLPFKLDVTLLAEAWENDDYESLMQPVVEAMQIIESVIPIIEQLLERAKQEFKVGV